MELSGAFSANKTMLSRFGEQASERKREKEQKGRSNEKSEKGRDGEDVEKFRVVRI